MDIQVDFWNVGQGDCTAVTLSDDKLVIIDTGNVNSPIYDWLIENPKTKIHSILITHNDADHIGSLQSILHSCGSFNYLYAKDSEDIMTDHMDDLSNMIKVLKEEYDSPNRMDYVDMLNDVRIVLERARGNIACASLFLERKKLIEVMRAVEWNQSGDTSKQSVEDAMDRITPPKHE